MKQHIIICVFLAITTLLTACSSDIIEPIEEEPISPSQPDAYHNKQREEPYPKENNEVFVNPPPLIVPQKMKTGATLQFSLSSDANFTGGTTIESKALAWSIFNPHQDLAMGKWYWRFRNINGEGVNGEWSKTYSFTIKPETPKYLTPNFNAFIDNSPRGFPRLFCFLESGLDKARLNLTSHSEYSNFAGRAKGALNKNYTSVANPYDKAEEIKTDIIILYQTYLLTQDIIYQKKILESARMLLNYPLTDGQLFATNFGATDIALIFIKTYDIAYDQLTGGERQSIEDVLVKVSRYYYKLYCGAQENHIFDNHFWQHNLRILFQASFMLYTNDKYSKESTEMLEYYYELWSGRAPDSGFNRSGLWRNGVSYFSVNVKTLYYMPSLFSYITKSDFLQHPWYHNAGKAIAYSWPPNSKSSGFGDGSEKGEEPNRLRVAYADFLARELADPYASWYASKSKNLLNLDYEFRLYRMASNKQYDNQDLPQKASKLVWHKDAGEVTVHSNLADVNNDLALCFRSSTFGSGSHTLSDQNSFNLLYKGIDIYRSSGYYINFSGAHNLMSYRHTRAHNTILVNGIGQPFSMNGYGSVVRAIDGDNISYCLGDASNAYSGLSDDPLWVKAFEEAGITQTPDNGFGHTPLKLYRRHVFVLHPDIVVLYDELEATEDVRWDWLLHAPVKFDINNSLNKMVTTYKDKGFKTVAQIFSDVDFNTSQTDQFVVPPQSTPDPQYPNQWHLTAAFSPSSKNHILTIIQTLPEHKFPLEISKNGDVFKCGKWVIKANLDVHKPATVTVSNTTNNIVFSYGAENPIINGRPYSRDSKNSSLLYDLIDGEYKVVELTDYHPISTRMAKSLK